MPTGSGVERSIETVLGIERPDGAPQQMRTLALAWRNAGELFIASASACERHADTLLNSGEGHVAAAVAAGSRRTAQLARSSGECCLSLGAETDDAAVGVEFGQLSWDYIGLITLIQLSAAAYAALCTGGVAAPQALQIRLAGRHAVATALRKVLEFIATGGIKAHMKRHVLLAGSAAWGGALGAAVPLAAQLKQMTEGRRDQVDWQSAVTSGAAGLVGGLAGAAAASALSPLVGRVAARIAGAGGARGPRIGAAVFSTTALGVGAGLAGGPAGAGAGLLVDAGYQYNRTGVVLGEDRDKLAADLWNNAWTGALGGVVGGAIDAADAARTAVSAGLPYPAALQHGVPDSALRWPQSWVSRLGESGTVHADRLAAAEQLAALPPGSPEHDLLSEQIAYVNTLAHKRINLLTDVDLGQRLASYPHEARANHRSLLAELDAVSTALAPAHSGSAGPFGIRDQAGTGLSDRQVVQAVNDRYGRIVVRELRDLDGYQRALGRASEAYDLLSRIPPGVTAVLRTERGQTAAVWVTNAHGSITDIAAAATRPVPAVSPVDAAAATLLLFAPDGTVIPAAVELPPRAGPFSGPEPAAPLPLIWPSGSGGYLPPLPRQQDALACSLLQPDGFYEVGADPSRHIYHKLVNPDGIHRPSGRATNCVDSALAALSSFYGRPQVAPVQVRSELTTPWVELGERRGRSRQARWLRGEWQVADRPPAPGAIAHRAHFNQKYEELHKEIDRQGPLAAALVSVDWCYSNRYGAMVDQNGWTRGPDGMHAFVVVFPREAAGPVWWDPQSGRTWNHPPAHYAAVTHRLRYLRIQNDP